MPATPAWGVPAPRRRICILVTVADAQGLRYYSQASLVQGLSMDVEQLCQARTEFIRAGLIAYERPVYQVLALDPAAAR